MACPSGKTLGKLCAEVQMLSQPALPSAEDFEEGRGISLAAL